MVLNAIVSFLNLQQQEAMTSSSTSSEASGRSAAGPRRAERRNSADQQERGPSGASATTRSIGGRWGPCSRRPPRDSTQRRGGAGGCSRRPGPSCGIYRGRRGVGRAGWGRLSSSVVLEAAQDSRC